MNDKYHSGVLHGAQGRSHQKHQYLALVFLESVCTKPDKDSQKQSTMALKSTTRTESFSIRCFLSSAEMSYPHSSFVSRIKMLMLQLSSDHQVKDRCKL